MIENEKILLKQMTGDDILMIKMKQHFTLRNAAIQFFET
jgi:hypothetical protein